MSLLLTSDGSWLEFLARNTLVCPNIFLRQNILVFFKSQLLRTARLAIFVQKTNKFKLSFCKYDIFDHFQDTSRFTLLSR